MTDELKVGDRVKVAHHADTDGGRRGIVVLVGPRLYTVEFAYKMKGKFPREVLVKI